MNSVTVTFAIVGIIVGIVYVGLIRRRNQEREVLTVYKEQEALYRRDQADLVAKQLEQIEKSLAEREQRARELKNDYDKKYRSSSGNGSSDSTNS
jgi:uncharacterized membrane-anchored protein YhcB (DUF1043 family)